jgi:hypothetical protein
MFRRLIIDRRKEEPMDRMHCALVADVAKRYGRRSRLKLRREEEPEPWGNWLIVPTPGYLEAECCGPWAWREVEWVEVDVGDHGSGPVAAAFVGAGLPAQASGQVVRVACGGAKTIQA